MTLATKLALASIAMLTCVLGAEFVALGWLALRDARSHADEELQATTRSSAALFSAYYDDALRQSRVNFDLLLAGLGWSSRLNEFHDEDGRRRRILAADRAAVDDANARLDQFAEATGAEASIFVRAGDEFVRIASSLRLRDGTRALGTALDLHHPAYDAIVRGAEFNGPAMVFNHLLMTRYVPIWSDGKVVGIIVAGSSLTETMNKLAESLRLLRPVQSGLAYGVFLGPDPELGRMVGLDAGARIDRQTPQAAAFLGALQAVSSSRRCSTRPGARRCRKRRRVPARRCAAWPSCGIRAGMSPSSATWPARTSRGRRSARSKSCWPPTSRPWSC